jgi:hypothetical protein
LHSDNVGSSLGGAVSPQIGQGMSVEILRELVQKRILTLTYIRNIHEGCVKSDIAPLTSADGSTGRVTGFILFRFQRMNCRWHSTITT